MMSTWMHQGRTWKIWTRQVEEHRREELAILKNRHARSSRSGGSIRKDQGARGIVCISERERGRGQTSELAVITSCDLSGESSCIKIPHLLPCLGPLILIKRRSHGPADEVRGGAG